MLLDNLLLFHLTFSFNYLGNSIDTLSPVLSCNPGNVVAAGVSLGSTALDLGYTAGFAFLSLSVLFSDQMLESHGT